MPDDSNIVQLKPKRRGVHANEPDLVCPVCNGTIVGGNISFYGPIGVVTRLVVAEFKMECPNCQAELKLTIGPGRPTGPLAPVVPLHKR